MKQENMMITEKRLRSVQNVERYWSETSCGAPVGDVYIFEGALKPVLSVMRGNSIREVPNTATPVWFEPRQIGGLTNDKQCHIFMLPRLS